jgi:hypothetical protein
MKHAREAYNNRIQDIDLDRLAKFVHDLITSHPNLSRGDALGEFRQIMESPRIPPNEPVFLIRAQDEVGAKTVMAWAHLNRQAGGSDIISLSAEAHARKMEDWLVKKLADL